MEKEFIPTYMEALSILHRCPFYTINPCEGEFKPIRGIYNRYNTNNMTIAQQLKVTKFPFFIRDENGNKIYWEARNRFWSKREYDERGNEIYYENSDGTIRDRRPKSVPEYTMEELVDKLGHNFKIKK